MILSSNDLHKTVQSFKQYTAKQILELLKKENAKTILDQLMFYKKANHEEKTYQAWEEGYQPKLIQDDKIMIQKINYIHQNPIKRGYVNEAWHRRYSSARDYEDMVGLVKVCMSYTHFKYWSGNLNSCNFLK